MLGIDPNKVCFIIVKAREFDAKVDVVEPDPGSNPSDEDMRTVLEDYPDDPVYEELESFIDGLNEDERARLVALLWLGRGDFGKDEWVEALREARRARDRPTASYLLGTPLLPDYLEEGLSRLGHSCEDFEMGHL